ncbi:MAG: adenylate/guanylate cyclase domain-containing protein [Chelatococcus sp.]|jgi:adenylate cyclase|uniref:adenylate/guanylate cyclase domain-containing protein n=1 Tax=unclassified Chelatococcus TaxID=2638111 RepID=UPI001BD038F8|nr:MULTISPECIES: adenylate/guanylate cyclase domain-containing protein [unclassified Chelatococcus]CAH1657916.1 Adenylate cyclase [Hyphomicrobiales bacterium]MBS7740739.1 adenylate/guanylate cyclase domain-containing protein [Chelatococcus sp. HY11]MBX3536997.1 adenylate/guanylate cyclase domain-containing protein [Chelatococcus sp.]MBX3546027.1 adenylate/guanylate cyclase domain-containing protein [Chelatococcus sp.]MCO5079654.1 adenylate/guanylate cyclase domain-containing protein [Chelatoco
MIARSFKLPKESDVLLLSAELSAERTASLVRMITGIVLLAAIAFVDRKSDFSPIGERQVLYAQLTVLTLFLSGLLSYGLVRVRLWRWWMSFGTATIDMFIVAFNIWLNVWVTGLTGQYILSFPIIAALPLVFASNALRLRPSVQIYTTVLLVLSMVAVGIFAAPAQMTFPRPPELMVQDQFGWQPNFARVVILLLTGGILILAAARGRKLLVRAVEETTIRLNLGRYLPAELAPVLAEGRISELKAGRRSVVTLMFVDIRGSTAMEESLSPSAVVELIGTFREHVMAAAAEHGGVIDKFIGDGAFLVFGMPEPGEDDAARALACGRAILDRMDKWNLERGRNGFDPIRIGIGVHSGEAFIGAIGNDMRLDFTVLGDAVNVACRLEQATKLHQVAFLVSEEALDAAHADRSGWRHIGEQSLRGRAEPIELFTPADLASWETAEAEPASQAS